MNRRALVSALATLLASFALSGCGTAMTRQTEGASGQHAAAETQASMPAGQPGSPSAPAVAPGSESYGYEGADLAQLPEAAPTALAQAAPAKNTNDPGAVASSSGAVGSLEQVPDARSGPLLIYTADVHIAVFEVKRALTAAEALARGSKGYVVQQTNDGITFRVPAEAFQSVLDRVLELGDVTQRNVQARDVTEEFFDVQTRSRTLEAMRVRLEELLGRAQKVEEALAVERELGRVVAEIERLKGRLKLLRELIAFSTFALHFRPRVVESLESSVPLPFPWLHTLGLGPLLAL